jgi:hypothetical protein
MLQVVALPRWAPGDGLRLQTWRVKHQPHGFHIPAFISLVRHPHELSEGDFMVHVRAVAARMRPFPLALTYALPVMWDGQQARVFLMPEQGAGELWRLHRTLFSGVLAPWMPDAGFFLPHLLLASYSMPQMALTVADQWNHHEAPLHAEIDTVAVMRLGAERPQWLAQFELGEGAA